MLAVVPACEEDVSLTVQLAQKYGVPFAARSGHHCVTTSMRHLQDGILIDMRRFQSMTLNKGEDVKMMVICCRRDVQLTRIRLCREDYFRYSRGRYNH